jgi:hypothetical protein
VTLDVANEPRVFDDPVPEGDHVTITASMYEHLIGLRPGRGRAVAVIDAGPEGVRVKPIVDVARLAAAAATGALAIWAARRVGARR